MNFLTVPMSAVIGNRYQTRQEYGDIAELAGQIAAARDAHPDTFGLLQVPRGRLVYQDTHGPDIVAADFYSAFIIQGELHKDEPNLRIQLAFGHRRLRAFRHLHETGVEGYGDGLFPLYVGHLDDTAMIDAVWGENSQRKNISAIEEAELLQKKLEQLQANGGGSQRDVAEAWGIARPTVSNKLRLLQLPPEIQQANREGKLSERVCADLLRVTEVQQAANGSDWKALARNEWYYPDPPEALITTVLSDPENAKSDDVREWLSLATDRMGQQLPELIIKFEATAEESPNVEQPTCNSCPRRVNRTCYAPDCLSSKKQQWVQTKLNELAEMHNLGIAADKDHPVGSVPRQQIKEAWDSGVPADWLLGWKTGSYMPRPWAGEYSQHITEREAFADDGMTGFYVTVPDGRLTDEQLAILNKMKQSDSTAEAEERPDMAGDKLRDEWRMAASKYGHDIIEAAKLALVEACDLKPGNTADIFQALLNGPKAEWIESENIQALRRRLVDFLWDKGKGWEDYPGNAALILRRAQSLLEDAGIDHHEILSTGTKSGDYKRDAICSLEYFYDWYNVSWGNHRFMAVTYIEELLQRWPTGEDEVLNPLGEELQRVVRLVATWATDSEEDEA